MKSQSKTLRKNLSTFQPFNFSTPLLKKFLILLTIPLLLISCGKKRVITSQGEMIYNEKTVQWEIFEEHDTCFKVITDNSILVAILSAPTESHLKDSTFFEKIYFPNGAIAQTKSYLHRKPDGEWTSWYSASKKKAVSKTANGVLIEFRSWYENGKPKVTGRRGEDGRMTRREFFINGKPHQVFDTDSLGNGTCMSFFMTGKKEAEGNIYKFSPVGVWKRYDSLGKPQTDTLYGLDPSLTGK